MSKHSYALPAVAELTLLFVVVCVLGMAYHYLTADLSPDGRFVLAEGCSRYDEREVEDARTGQTQTYSTCVGDTFTQSTPVNIWLQDRLWGVLVGGAMLSAVVIGTRRNW